MAHIERVYNKEKTKVIAYKAVVEVGSGKNRKRRTKRFKTAGEAENWIAAMTTDINQGTIVDPNNITVAQWFEQCFEQYKYTVASTTYDNDYRRYLAHIKEDLGFYRLQDLQPVHLEKYFYHKRLKGRKDGKGGLSENSLNKLYILMNKFLRKAVKYNLIHQNPLEPIDSPRPEPYKANVMSEEEFNLLLNVAREHDPFMFVFICTVLYTGLRISEALGLTWPEIDFQNKIINVVRKVVYKRGHGIIVEEKLKNKSSRRSIKISDRLCELLKEHKKRQLEMRLFLGPDYKGDVYDFVFCKEDGTIYYPTSINKKMRILMNKAGLPYKSQIHILRHTFATLNVNSGVGPEIVQKILGHSTIKTTIDTYYHPDVEIQKKAVDVMDRAINIE